MPGTILFAANRSYSLNNSRRHMIQFFLSQRWRVVIATTDHDSGDFDDLPLNCEHVPFHRGTTALAQDVRAYRAMRKVCRRWQPDLVLNFHAKPVILGSIAARRTLGKRVRIVNTITGIGSLLRSGPVQSRIADIGFRSALKRADATVFQNPDDRELFLEKKWIKTESARLVIGSGIDVNRFSMIDRDCHDPSFPVVVMIARLLKSKGIPEFAEVARRIRQERPRVRFLLAGEVNQSHPDAIDMPWLEAQQDIEYVGNLPDVLPLLRDADLFLYPSQYGEGVPRVIMEAAATALPTIAFDVAGVREAVENGQTGHLVTPTDIDALTAATRMLLDDRDQRLAMGFAARQHAGREFDVQAIQSQYVDISRSLGVPI
jgi:glycosyltransferase involved in cell wall biosynthesis